MATTAMNISGNVSDDTNDTLFIFARYRDLNSFMEVFMPSYVIIDRAITPIWIFLGLILNPISAKIWLERRIRKNNSSAIYLASLSVCDFAYLIIYLLFELSSAWGLPLYHMEGLCESFYFFFYWPQYLSPLLVLAFTVKRYIAVCHPFAKERFCTVPRAIKGVAGLVVLCMLLSLMQPFGWSYDIQSMTCSNHDSFRKAFEIWTWVTEILVFGVVPIAVLLFNMLVLWEIKRLARESGSMLPYQQRQGSNTAASTVTLLSVSFYLILTTLPVTLVYIIAFSVPHGEMYIADVDIWSDSMWTYWFRFMLARKTVEELCLSHYSCYFFIYCLTGKQFRTSLKENVCCYLKLCTKSKKDNVKYKVVNGNDGHTCVSFV